MQNQKCSLNLLVLLCAYLPVSSNNIIIISLYLYLLNSFYQNFEAVLLSGEIQVLNVSETA